MTTNTANTNLKTNGLIDETSPYLLQHAHNPVDWYPWSESVLEKARIENKPILLSIGYSACHWCHVMAHESFEDEKTAQVMNELFVNIKVDREERPDLDKIYQTAHQLLTQRTGGWPLTMFLTPDDQTPFFGGTYFPPEQRHGLPGFKDLLKRVADFYTQNKADIDKQNASLINALAQTESNTNNEQATLTMTPLDDARYQLEKNFDNVNGGFGNAPKFPHPTNLEFLLRHWANSSLENKEDKQAFNMARMTLHTMASGGIYDQLGGGFCRYSVDDHWMIPHFEKMLYDNAQLLPLYAQAYVVTKDQIFRRIAEETAEWVMREMQSPEGGYYSTLDADTEGEEGKFYVWQPEQVKTHLNDDEYAVIALRYGLDRPANFEGEWHLHVYTDDKEIADKTGFSTDKIRVLITSAHKKLFDVRSERVVPGRDEKILTSWNGLMIRGMAIAGRLLQRKDFIESAEHAMNFIRNTLWKNDRLLATYKDGKAHLNAYLDDYVFLADGVLELLQTRFNSHDLSFAITLADTVLEHFEDKNNGGFFFTSDDHENLIHRPKPFIDDALPAGNGVAAYILGRLGHLLGNMDYIDASESTFKSAWQGLSQLPYAHTALLIALEEHLVGLETIIIRGNGNELERWHQHATQNYSPRRYTLAIPANNTELPGLLAERTLENDSTTAYICSGFSCETPITDYEKLIARLP